MDTVFELLKTRLDQIVYHPQDFVGRDKESSLVQKMLEDAWARVLFMPLLILFGIHGIGKSWLLEHWGIRYAFSVEEWQRSGQSSASVVVKLAAYRDSLLSILVAIAKGLESGLGPVAIELGLEQLPSLAQTPSATLSDWQIRDKFDELVGILQKLCDKHIVPVLLFDSAEQLPKPILDNLIEWLVKPLILRQDIVFVFAARGRFELWDLKVRQRCIIQQLEPFTREDIIAKIRTRGNGLSFEPIEQFSCGHPLATEAVYECTQIIAEQAHLLRASDVFESNAEQVAQLLDAVVVQDRFMQGVNDEQRKLLEAVCVLRKFNPTSLKRFASKFVDEKYARESTAFYLRALGDLIDSKLVVWSGSARGHVLDPIVRQIMSHDLQVRAPEVFHARHQEAADMYDQIITESPAQGSQFILERFYHLACLSGVSKETIEKEIYRVLSAGRPDMVDQILNLKKEFCGDESIQGDQELRQLLGEDFCSMLDERLDKFLHSS
jgi:hypothetical protein